MIYHDFDANTFIHLDSETNICSKTQITIGASQYLSDIQISEENSESTKESIAVKFVLNDGTEHECGVAANAFSSIVPQGGATDEIAVIGLTGGLNNNQPAPGELYNSQNYLVQLGASYLNLPDFEADQRTDFLAKSDTPVFVDVTADLLDLDSAWPPQVY